MVVEDEIRAKGLGVVLEGSIRDEEDVLQPAEAVACDDLQIRYYRARFEACRDGMWFSIVLNGIFIVWIAWTVMRG